MPHIPGSIVVAVFPYNRLNYIKLTVDALLKNPESSTYPFYFFADGNLSDPKILEVSNYLDSTPFNHKYIIRRNQQFGPCRNIVNGISYLFNEIGYDRVIILEDDIVVSKTFLKFIINLSDYWHKYDNVGYVTGWYMNHDSPEEKMKKLSDCIVSFSFMAGVCITKKVWDTIKHIVHHYEYTFLANSMPFGHCQHRESIVEYMCSYINEHKSITEGNILDISERDKDSFYRGLGLNPALYPSSQDMLLISALSSRGFYNIASVVPRVYMGGEHGGAHMTSGLFKQFGLDRVLLHEFEEDKNLKEFNLV